VCFSLTVLMFRFTSPSALHCYSCFIHCLCNVNFYTHDRGVLFISNNIACDAQQLRFVVVQVFVKIIIGKLEINDCRCDPLF